MTRKPYKLSVPLKSSHNRALYLGRKRRTLVAAQKTDANADPYNMYGMPSKTALAVDVTMFAVENFHYHPFRLPEKTETTLDRTRYYGLTVEVHDKPNVRYWVHIVEIRHNNVHPEAKFGLAPVLTPIGYPISMINEVIGLWKEIVSNDEHLWTKASVMTDSLRIHEFEFNSADVTEELIGHENIEQCVRHGIMKHISSDTAKVLGLEKEKAQQILLDSNEYVSENICALSNHMVTSVLKK